MARRTATPGPRPLSGVPDIHCVRSGEQVQPARRASSSQDQQALASWSVVTVLLLQHTHSRAQRVIPTSDYADVCETQIAYRSDESIHRPPWAAGTEQPRRGVNHALGLVLAL